METEYKIIQATTPHFANNQNLSRVMAEESQAGWTLVEKFDNYKIRVQRSISHRASDAGRAIDPYRTQVGPSNILTYSAAAAVTLAIVYMIFRAVGALP
ncbi:MAG: hypothetical protein Q8S94_10140 [Pseudohongiella sp.]|jgi:hypothetical protein|nr:hypothetical protein [Pseudohongiella sp.]